MYAFYVQNVMTIYVFHVLHKKMNQQTHTINFYHVKLKYLKYRTFYPEQNVSTETA